MNPRRTWAHVWGDPAGSLSELPTYMPLILTSQRQGQVKPKRGKGNYLLRGRSPENGVRGKKLRE